MDGDVNVVVLCGRVSSAPVGRELAGATVVWSLDVATATESGTISVPVTWSHDARPQQWEVGAAVMIVGVVRRRFFRSAGSTQSRTEVVAAFAEPIGQRGPGASVWRRAIVALGSEEVATLRSGFGTPPRGASRSTPTDR